MSKKLSMTMAEMMALAAQAKPIPVAMIQVMDWASVWDAVQRDGHFVLNCTNKEQRLFYQWSLHHRQTYMTMYELARDIWLVRMKTPITKEK